MLTRYALKTTRSCCSTHRNLSGNGWVEFQQLDIKVSALGKCSDKNDRLLKEMDTILQALTTHRRPLDVSADVEALLSLYDFQNIAMTRSECP